MKKSVSMLRPREHLVSTVLVCLLMVTVGMHGSLVCGASNQAYSEELSAPEKVLAFLTDVVKLDMAKYNATLVSNWVDYPPHWGGLPQEDVTYDINWAGESKLYVTCKLRDGTLYSCGLEVLEGSPIYAEPQPTNVLDATKVLLERYQTYSGSSYLQTMLNMLDTIDEIEDMTTTAGNMKLTISIEDIPTAPGAEPIIYTNFDWVYRVNGIDAPQNVVSFTFNQGVFRSFRDDWNLCKIGSTEVNVSEEEAINMAMDAAKNYTLKIWMNEWIEVKFNIVDEPVTAELFMYPRETLTVYPFWRIELYFDKLYYSAYGIQVGIWADTKQIKYCESLSYTGGPPDGENMHAFIRADGSVEGTDKIQRDGNIYSFTGDINGSIVVERNNIVVDGAGHTLQGTGSGKGIDLSDRSNTTIQNVEIKEFNDGIWLYNSSNNAIIGNTITANNQWGIRLAGSSNNTVSGNTITNNDYGGIVVMDSDNNTITGNTITNNFVGLDFTASENNIVSGNLIANNDEDGIHIENINNSIIENTITNNGDVGILLHGAGYNSIIGNNITNNRRGILVSICYNNVIYHNNFVKNTFHIETDESNGIWDNGSEGNYWDVYTGIDSNGDGIGDTPYVIDENNQDNYPLMNQWIPSTQHSEPFPTTLIAAAIVTVAVVGAALLVYFRKIKKPTEVEKIPEGVK